MIRNAPEGYRYSDFMPWLNTGGIDVLEFRAKLAARATILGKMSYEEFLICVSELNRYKAVDQVALTQRVKRLLRHVVNGEELEPTEEDMDWLEQTEIGTDVRYANT